MVAKEGVARARPGVLCAALMMVVQTKFAFFCASAFCSPLDWVREKDKARHLFHSSQYLLVGEVCRPSRRTARSGHHLLARDGSLKAYRPRPALTAATRPK